MVTFIADVNGSSAHAPIETSTINDSNSSDIILNARHVPPSMPIAICGMSVRLPGGIHSPQQLWEFLLAKRDARGPIPKSRYNASAYFSDAAKPGSIRTEHGYFLDDSIDIATVDTSFFNMGKAEVEKMDPHQRQMLEVARECMEDAGMTNYRGKAIGCYMGSFGEDWVEAFAKENQQYGLHRVSGYGDFVLANRVSYELDLMGPSITIRTACSASLVALNEACSAITKGDCEGAIVGGANLIMGPGMTAAMSEQGVLSPDGCCKSFSADANGYARGEAISAIFIKPLDDAIRDGNTVRAVIRATATNSDGRGTGGMQVPDALAQEKLIRHAYQSAGITDLSQTAYVECHGTGTPVGDPIEATAVGRVFGPHGGIQIGSVKSNLGHSEGASGLTSVIKSVLALENRIIPPSLHLGRPNPAIPWDSYQLSVPTEAVSWPKSRCERISVNSFGIGGSNAHVVLDSARSFGLSPVPMRPTTTPQLLLYSATSAESLKKIISNYGDFVLKNPDRVSDLAFTLANKREHLPHRAYAVVDLFGGVTSSLTFKTNAVPNIAMVFTGQGAQWAEMGRCMFCCDTFPAFTETIRSLDLHLQTLSHAPTLTIEDEIKKPTKLSSLNSAEISQPLCTAIQIALVDTLASIGVSPTAVIGHSSGEIAAAYAAGAIERDQAIQLAFYRGYVTKLQTRHGSMAAIGMGSKEVQGYLQPGLVIACENSPRSVTLSGETEAVETAISRIKTDHPGVLARLLRVDKAYHSHHMAEIGSSYHALIQSISAKAPQILFFSSVEDGKLIRDASLGPDYWQKNLESPVLFRSAVLSLLRHEISRNMVFLEIGPHSALEGPLRQIQSETSNTSPYSSTLIRNKNDVESLLGTIGKLHSLKYPIDLQKVIPSGSTLPNLPRYPWDHSKRYWYESRLTKEWRHPAHPHHNLLGRRTAESTDFDVSFRNLFHMDNAPWMRDHKIGTDVIFPFAGYAEMIGEALKQLNDSQNGFKLRRTVISTALVLQDNGSPVEIMTTMRRNRLTDAVDSDWWAFTIAAHNGSSWTKHCFGEAKSHCGEAFLEQKITQLVRRVPTSSCYSAMARAGLNYGPTFQRLGGVCADTLRQEATAEITTREYDTRDYHLHPSIIDASLQLYSAAATKGYANAPARMMIPTRIEEIFISSCYENIQLRVSAKNTPNGSIIGNGECATRDGRIVLRASGVKLSCVQDDPAQGPDGFARLEWGPHIDFMDVASLIKPPTYDRGAYMDLLTELSHLCMIQSRRAIEKLDTPLVYMHKYRDWINHQLQSADVQHLEELQSELIEYKIEAMIGNLENPLASMAALAIQKICRNVPRIFTGELEALDILLTDDTLTELYAFMDQCDQTQLVRHLAHRKPNLRILEIGAGTGGSTAHILSTLTADKRTLYSRYTFSDISAGFFPAAKERFNMYSSMEYTTLDISKDPSEQGFDGRKYDLIIASNVIHATSSLNETLCNVRKLLESNGHFILNELAPTHKWVNYIWGVLPGWWCGEADGRIDEPYISIERWREELTAAGFLAPNAVVFDAEEPYQLGAVIVTRPDRETLSKKRVTLLALCQSSPVTLLQEELVNRGYVVDYRELLNDTPLPAEQDVIAMLDEEVSFFEDMDDQRLNSFKKVVEDLKSSRLLWVTGLSQIQCQDPQFAQINGIARSIRLETLVEFGTCEVDDISRSASKVIDVFEKFELRQDDEILKPDYEYAILNNVVHVGRFHSFSPESELLQSKSGNSVALRVGKLGRLSSLHWSYQDTRVLRNDDVEVEVHATGLNFKDVLCALDIVEAPGNGFGLEAAGVVHRTGPNVRDLEVGDRIMLLSSDCFSTDVVVSEKVCERIPAGLSFEDAATMPCVFATAVYSLFEVGNLQAGQSILIHSACGGVGLAAIQLAQMAGARIFATVGSEEKIKFLVDRYGLSRKNIFNSRDISFAENVMKATDDEGVDLALNSLSGELLHATWSCIGEFGKMVDISKRDAIGFGKLDMVHFIPNRSYSCVDLDHICRKRPNVAKRLLKQISHLLKERYIHPIRPIQIFKADAILDAFRYMQQGIHLGKIVVSMRDPQGALTVQSNIQVQRAPISFDSSGVYLLVGGLGGVGRSVSTWMAAHRARHLIYLSPSAGTKLSHCEFAKELLSMGCHVDFVQGDVSSLKDVIKAVTRSEGRLKGILQMCMALDNQTLTRMTSKEWNFVVDPKVNGTWNLHNASTSANCDLDFFVMFSSISGICGQPGQTNYAGANTFLDAFSQYRSNLGLPACSIEVGAVEEVGYLAEHEGIRQQLRASNALPSAVSESEVLTALKLAISKPQPNKGQPSALRNNNICLGLRSSIPLNDANNRLVWKKDIRMGVFHNIESSDSAAGTPISDDLKSFVQAAKKDAALLANPDSAHFLAVEIGKKLFSFLLKPEEDLVTWCSLAELGMDSLVAIEVRQWWRQIFEFDISVLEMLGMSTLDALGQHAATEMLKLLHGAQS
ncbi:Acyl transferase/acyl hydrolase/lysophospholipase [Penicillium malachiteum]|uniref:Acyl transferase/acyl hydrolase/lysophospholipase n=1 Tax=Penicillium malachiteum TaxID=1324776 RepID=UPI002548CAE0|nr:Acyl transferase/acyl hydrolase/lysophospholipase [Penicillium malachiteum]KAJ5720443.1 Acyl transferase/acyl hydrolase/lysophospholipase [Penicillium malachiteum]